MRDLVGRSFVYLGCDHYTVVVERTNEHVPRYHRVVWSVTSPPEVWMGSSTARYLEDLVESGLLVPLDDEART